MTRHEDWTMLVVCNGNMKSGSTWLVALVRASGLWKAMPDEWRDMRWKNASISEQHVDAYFQSRQWLDSNHYCKQHWRGEARHLRLYEHDSVKVLNSVRDIRDVLVSRYFHDIKLGTCSGGPIDRFYFEGVGRKAMRRFIEYHNAWAGAPPGSHHLVRFEGLVNDFDHEVTQMFAHLGVELAPHEIAHLKRSTDFITLRGAGQAFYRKGTVGDWKNHLGEAVIADLLALCRELSFSYRIDAA